MSKRCFEPDDLFLHKHITTLDCDPHHQRVACCVESVERDQDTYTSAIWLYDLEGDAPGRQLTSGTALDGQPCWSPDGRRLAFLSDRGGNGLQLHLIAADGGEARQLGHFDMGASSPSWHPDGSRLLVTAAVPVDPQAHGARRKEKAAPRDPTSPELVWRLPYKLDGSGYTLDREKHLFVVDAGSGKATQLTDGAFDVRGAAWSPDGQRIAHIRTRDGAPHCTDLWLMDADGGNARRLSQEQSSLSSPVWTPKGDAIVCTGATDEGDAQSRLWRVDPQRGHVEPLGDASIEAVSAGTPCWSRDGRQLAFVIAKRGLQSVAAIDVDTGQVRLLVEGRRHIDQLCATSQRLVFTTESPERAETLRVAGWDGGQERELADHNAWWSDRAAPVVEPRRLHVPAPDLDGGTEEIDGWLMLPPDRSGPFPLLVDGHGGPASYVLLAYTSHVYWQVLCSRGWAVLALDTVGSSSYGRDFASRLRGRWGELDLQQHLAAVDALQREGIADQRVAITGKSYGGYLSAWAIGQTQRFRCAVVSAPVSNLEAHYGTSDSGFYADPYSLCGEPYINREASRKLSPMQHVQHTTTPTLILQGKDDERCPKGQAEELYATIARAGPTPTELVLYPGGSHHFFESGKPSHRLDAVQRCIEWLERWIDKELRKRPQDDTTPAAHARSDSHAVTGRAG